MELNTVIFDMDGLLIDSEPLWSEAADEVLGYYGKKLTKAEYAQTTGLRTSEFVSWWLRDYKFDDKELKNAAEQIIQVVTQKIIQKGQPMPGIKYIFDFFSKRGYKIGIASSSPLELVKTVADMLQVSRYVKAIASAEHLNYGKPHPQVYLDCAASLGSSPLECVCFEDSVNGMIAAKAARMKCVVVPVASMSKDERWSLADLKISSLQNFSELHINLL
ncbi:hexitol phosphatase HxpB [Aridibaculum aurantiacum]|uniref:hexitol phosphatase HxpB n=1 Tax=Aridibaculum aurantiacum TaxID=2810307 RepID=UPI001A95795E|nr:hexitol phosphatase HxpB [Aridibaculum aurantiacum]